MGRITAATFAAVAGKLVPRNLGLDDEMSLAFKCHEQMKCAYS